MHNSGAVLLRHAVIIAQGNDLPLLLGQLFYGRAQRHMLDHLLFRRIIAKDVLQCKSVLTVFLLQALRRPGRNLGKSYLFG